MRKEETATERERERVEIRDLASTLVVLLSGSLSNADMTLEQKVSI